MQWLQWAIVDSPLEEGGFELSVPLETEWPLSHKNVPLGKANRAVLRRFFDLRGTEGWESSACRSEEFNRRIREIRAAIRVVGVWLAWSLAPNWGAITKPSGGP